MGEKKGHASVVMVVTPKGIVVVREPTKPKPIYWKLPGGMSEEGETPLQTAVRELAGETGVRVSPEKFNQIYKRDKGRHDYYLFRVDLDFVPELARVGHEGEEPAIMTPQEILGGNNFLPPQLEIIRPHLRLMMQKGK